MFDEASQMVWVSNEQDALMEEGMVGKHITHHYSMSFLTFRTPVPK